MVRWLWLWVAGSTVAEAVPLTVSHQGRMLDAAGAPVDGVRTATFGLYAASSGGVALWEGAQSVTVADGYYAVVLSGLDVADVPDAGLFLQVQLPPDAPMPRIPVTSAPYAIRAELATSVSGGTVSATSIATTGALQLGDPGDAACTAGSAGTMRWGARGLEVCAGSTGWLGVQTRATDDGWSQTTPGASCNTIHTKYPWLGDGTYWVTAASGGARQVYCDMTTDGGGWTLGVRIQTDLGAINLFTYNNQHTNFATQDYGVNLSQMGLTSSTTYRLTCVESSDSATRTMFVRGLNPAESIFSASGTITKTNVQCASNVDFTGLGSGAACYGIDDNTHTYYQAPGADINWALFNGGAAYTLRHCRPTGSGYHNRGALWYR